VLIAAVVAVTAMERRDLEATLGDGPSPSHALRRAA
jgi:hypothetical protein